MGTLRPEVEEEQLAPGLVKHSQGWRTRGSCLPAQPLLAALFAKLILLSSLCTWTFQSTLHLFGTQQDPLALAHADPYAILLNP